METQKIIIATFTVLFFTQTQAQRITENRTGCVRTAGNIAGGYLFGEKQATAYFTGDIDVYIDPNVSITGAIWLSIPVNKKETGIKANHAVFWGFNYHFLKHGRVDPYIGLSPGLGVAQFAYKDGEEIKRTPYTPLPLVSGVVGVNYYIGSVFHFYAKAEGVGGQMFGNLPTRARLDELKLTAGMGINFGLWKPKKTM